MVAAGVATNLWNFALLVRHRDSNTTILRALFDTQYDVEPYGLRMALGLLPLLAGIALLVRA